MNEPISAVLSQQILSHLPAYVYVLDVAQRRLVYAGDGLLWSLGYPATVSFGDLATQLVHPEDWAVLAESLEGLENAPARMTLDIELRMKALDGVWHWLASRARVLTRDGDGAVTQLLAVSPDVSPAEGSSDRRTHNDHLTDLLTRRQFLGAVERLIAGGATQATLCVCDIDFFRGVNDSYGPLSGDRVLRAFAEILRRTLRQGDIIARLAGDRFAILFPATAPDHCAPPMERVREQLAATRFPTAGDVFSVTASFGLAGLDGIGDGEIWIEAAEVALTEARRRGRTHPLPGALFGEL